MRYSEIIASGVLSEMSIPRSDAIQKLRNGQEFVTNHILKVLCFRTTTDREHWIGEVRGWVTDMCAWKLRHNNKPVNPTLVFANLFKDVFSSDPERIIAARLKKMIANGYVLREDFDLSVVNSRLEAAIKIIASMPGAYDEQTFMKWVPT